jgi:hypothetical protein
LFEGKVFLPDAFLHSAVAAVTVAWQNCHALRVVRLGEIWRSIGYQSPAFAASRDLQPFVVLWAITRYTHKAMTEASCADRVADQIVPTGSCRSAVELNEEPKRIHERHWIAESIGVESRAAL